MKFNIKKYDRVTFHKDELVNKRVKALFLWLEYETQKKKLSKRQQIKLLDYWSMELERMEYYEIIPFFKKRRSALVDQIKKEKKIKDSIEKPKKLWASIKNFFNDLFSK